MPRVYEVARELGLSTKEVMARLDALGAPVTSHASSVDDATVERLRRAEQDTAVVSLGAGGSDTVLSPDEETTTRRRSIWRTVLRQLAELPLLVLLAFGIAVIIKTVLLQAFYIPSASMFPTLRVGDRVLVEKVSYFVGDPDRGDIVVFAKSVFGKPPDVPWTRDVVNFVRELLGLPTGEEEDYIKRVVAVGGDVVRYSGRPRRLVVNGDRVDEPFVARSRDVSSPELTKHSCRNLDMERVDRGCRVPAGHVFVMGDNRSNSEDSRLLGPIEEDKIVGRAFLIVWPPRQLDTI